MDYINIEKVKLDNARIKFNNELDTIVIAKLTEEICEYEKKIINLKFKIQSYHDDIKERTEKLEPEDFSEELELTNDFLQTLINKKKRKKQHSDVTI